jgi:hypothetical protein
MLNKRLTGLEKATLQQVIPWLIRRLDRGIRLVSVVLVFYLSRLTRHGALVETMGVTPGLSRWRLAVSLLDSLTIDNLFILVMLPWITPLTTAQVWGANLRCGISDLMRYTRLVVHLARMICTSPNSLLAGRDILWI